MVRHYGVGLQEPVGREASRLILPCTHLTQQAVEAGASPEAQADAPGGG